MPSSVDPALMEAWLRARSLSRGLPQPVPDSGGLRVDTGLPNETRRYMFARPVEGLREVAAHINEPRVPLKLCASPDVMRSYVSARWDVSPQNFVMICYKDFTRREAVQQLPDGYRLKLKTESAVTEARVKTATGELAASGYAACYDDVFVYDRIVTAETHRRKGFGTIVMTALASTRPAAAKTQILVATPAGRELYFTLGWTDYAPYTTAAIPEEHGRAIPIRN